jgi:ABC-type uncharacterized transport system auxiliary subunit
MRHNPSAITLVGLLATAQLAACGSAVPRHSYYRLVVAPPPVVSDADGGVIAARISVSELDAASGFGDARVVYRLTERKLRYYDYHEWVDGPGRMVADVLARHFAASGAFTDVVRGVRPVPDLIVDGTVLALEEVAREGGLDAHVAVDLVLRRANDGMVLWRGVLDRTKAVAKDNVDAVVEALGAAMDEGLRELWPGLLAAARAGVAPKAAPAEVGP